MKLSKRVRVAVGALTGVLLLYVLAWLLVPPLLRWQLEETGSQMLGRRVHIGAVDFKPWSLELTLTDLAVDTADTRAKQLSIGRLYLNLQIESLWRLAPVVQSVQLEAPTVRITHLGGGHYDVDDVLKRLSLPPDRAAPPTQSPARYALYNLLLNHGSVDFIDQDPARKSVQTHTLRQLRLDVPFLSNLEAYQSIEVSPRLAFVLNGAPFDTAAHGTPFAQTRRGEASLKVNELDLAPYLPYLPAALPVKIRKGQLDADVQLHFAEPPEGAAPHLSLRGRLALSDLQITDAAGAALLQLDALQTDMTDVRPLERSVKLANLNVTAPLVHLTRTADGAFNWDVLKPEPKRDTPPALWTVELAHFQLNSGALRWSDAVPSTHAQLAIKNIAIQAKNLHWPATSAAQLQGSAQLTSLAPATRQGRIPAAQLNFDAEGGAQKATLSVKIQGLGLDLAAPYTARYLEPAMVGSIDAALQVHWQDPQIKVAVQQLAINNFSLKPLAMAAAPAKLASAAGVAAPRNAAQEMPSWKLLEIKDAMLDMDARQLSVGSVVLNTPVATLYRDAEGQWAFMRWRKPAAEPSVPVTVAVAQTPWKLALSHLQLDNGNLKLEDRSPFRVVRLEVSKLQTQLKNIAWDGKNTLQKPVPVTLSAQIKSGRTDPGSIQYQGSIEWSPLLQVQGQFKALELPVHALYPYFANRLNMDVLRADASLQGNFQFSARPEGPAIQLQADALLEDVRTKSVPAARQGAESLGLGEELLRWKSLRIPGISLAIAPHAATRFSVAEIVWSDFYARVIVDENGRINLQDLVKPAAESTAENTEPAVPQPDAIVHLGPISLVQGKVQFSDRFIRPNYSADLTELNGKLSQISSVSPEGAAQLADVMVRGRAEGTAPLEIAGKLNPLAKPLALDVRGRVRDLELPPLSPYAIKYAGYGIERGKLSVDVHYRIDPDGQLKAANKIVLNQLTFGDKVESSSASLPVKLAVALLENSEGVIDVNLPISGSINDPDFRIGPVLFQVLGNLIKKAITSPFNLLSEAGEGLGTDGEDGSVVRFAAGSSALSAASAQALNALAQALAARPNLIVTVAGTASEEAERDALQRAQLQTLLQNHKRRRENVTDPNVLQATVLRDEEYAALLKEVYRRADMVKPRNAVGAAADLSTAEMETLMLANIKVNADAVRELALERSVVVKEYLLARQIPQERLFLGAAKIVPPDAAWSPRAEISLSVR